jgi:hypothetical protein
VPELESFTSILGKEKTLKAGLPIITVHVRVGTEAETRIHAAAAAAADHYESSAVLGPLVLPTNLFFFIRGEVVCNVEGLSDLLWRLALDHVGYCLAADV